MVSLKGIQLKPWYEWEVPPLWVWLVGSVVIVVSFGFIMWEISKRVHPPSIAQQYVPPKPRNDPNDPDSF